MNALGKVAASYLVMVVIISLGCTISLILFFKQFDQIVHGELYNYGLQFNEAWAQHYRNITYLIYFTLAVPYILFGAIGADILSSRNKPDKPQMLKANCPVQMNPEFLGRLEALENSMKQKEKETEKLEEENRELQLVLKLSPIETETKRNGRNKK